MAAPSTPLQLNVMELPTAEVLGYRVAVCTLEDTAAWCLRAARAPTPNLLVTLNPEIIVQAQTNPTLREALLSAELTVADGVGVVWAARRSGVALPERVPGVELATRVLERGGSDLNVYFLGAKPGVAERAAAAAAARYGVRVAGARHGYFRRPGEVAGVLEQVRTANPDLLLAGLGEGQELFLHENRAALNAKLMIGVGGTLDVIAGEVTRTPPWTRRLHVEWAYRIGSDPKRWHRFPRLARFVRLVLSHTKA